MLFPCAPRAYAAGTDNTAQAAIVVHPETGTVLYEKNADARLGIASTTKILTALVVLEHCALEESVEILPEYTAVEGSSMYLRAGETYTVEELLYGMMLVSGNDAALALAPEHLSCYGLKVEEGTPLFAQRKRFTLPDDDAQADMYLSAVGLLARQGYEQYEISNFCRPGRASRHNSRYWTLVEYLGFGPGAHSDFGGERFALARDLDAYLAGHIVYYECSAPSARERETERVMLALRTTRGVAADTLPEAARRILQNCEAHGLAHLSGGFYALTPRGFLVSNAILVDLLETMEL